MFPCLDENTIKDTTAISWNSISWPLGSLILTTFLKVNKRLKNNSPDCPFLSPSPLWQLQPVPYFGKPDEPCHLVDCNKKSI